MPETALPATDLDLISFLKAIPDARMRRGIRIPAWYLSGDSENWSGGDTKTGPPRGAQQQGE